MSGAVELENFGGGDHVEVLVEDLFIEEYDHPRPLVSSAKRGQPRRGAMRGRAPTLFGGLLAIGGLVVAGLLFKKRR